MLGSLNFEAFHTENLVIRSHPIGIYARESGGPKHALFCQSHLFISGCTVQPDLPQVYAQELGATGRIRISCIGTRVHRPSTLYLGLNRSLEIFWGRPSQSALGLSVLGHKLRLQIVYNAWNLTHGRRVRLPLMCCLRGSASSLYFRAWRGLCCIRPSSQPWIFALCHRVQQRAT